MKGPVALLLPLLIALDVPRRPPARRSARDRLRPGPLSVAALAALAGLVRARRRPGAGLSLDLPLAAQPRSVRRSRARRVTTSRSGSTSGCCRSRSCRGRSSFPACLRHAARRRAARRSARDLPPRLVRRALRVLQPLARQARDVSPADLSRAGAAQRDLPRSRAARAGAGTRVARSRSRRSSGCSAWPRSRSGRRSASPSPTAATQGRRSRRSCSPRSRSSDGSPSGARAWQLVPALVVAGALAAADALLSGGRAGRGRLQQPPRRRPGGARASRVRAPSSRTRPAATRSPTTAAGASSASARPRTPPRSWARSTPTAVLVKRRHLEKIRQHLRTPACIWWQSPSGRVLLANVPRPSEPGASLLPVARSRQATAGRRTADRRPPTIRL